jgi:hypothetical protein
MKFEINEADFETKINAAVSVSVTAAIRDLTESPMYKQELRKKIKSIVDTKVDEMILEGLEGSALEKAVHETFQEIVKARVKKLLNSLEGN